MHVFIDSGYVLAHHHAKPLRRKAFTFDEHFRAAGLRYERCVR